MIYEKDSKYDCETTTINYIINIIEKGNFKMNEILRNFTDTSSLLINNLLPFYELIELKIFKNITQEIKEKINKSKSELNIKEEIKNKIIKNINNKKNNLLFSKEILINGIKKYILRYCIGDNKNKNNILEKLDNNFEDIFKRSDIFGEKICKDDRFENEKNNLITINKEENCIIKYCYDDIFVDKTKKKKKKKKNKK